MELLKVNSEVEDANTINVESIEILLLQNKHLLVNLKAVTKNSSLEIKQAVDMVSSLLAVTLNMANHAAENELNNYLTDSIPELGSKTIH